ncbi:hypothetical protein COFA105466_10470 [Corynebacterium falsenii]
MSATSWAPPLSLRVRRMKLVFSDIFSACAMEHVPQLMLSTFVTVVPPVVTGEESN